MIRIFVDDISSIKSSEEFDKIKTDAIALLKHIDEMETNEITQVIKTMIECKLEINDFLDILAIWYRDALMFKATGDFNNLIFRDETRFIKETASHSSYEGIEVILKALDHDSPWYNVHGGVCNA